MEKTRLETFSDGVIAIIITIMVLELKAPHGDDLLSISKLIPIFLSYVLSFIYLAIYWNNHHHMFHTFKKVNASIMWANMHLLFWLSLIPFTTAWMGENHFSALPVALYGTSLLFAAIAYWVLQATIIKSQGSNSVLKQAIGNDLKGKLSPLFYILAIPLSFVSTELAGIIYITMAFIWLVPDRRIENAIKSYNAKS